MNRPNVVDVGHRRLRRTRKTPPALTAESKADVRELQRRYDAAHATYQRCMMALDEADVSGQLSAELVMSGAEAIRELTDARGRLIAAISRLSEDLPF